MKSIPFLDLVRLHDEIRPALDTAYKRVMDSGHFIMGPELDRFEVDFAEYCGVKYCFGVGNGLDAIYLLLKAYGIGLDDEVIVPSNTFIATWLAVSQCGATPIPVEPDITTHNIDPKKIEAKITKNTKAIIPVHLYGQTADMDPINMLAERFQLVVIEDSAQSQGAMYKGRRAGSLGHAAATSFYPGKNLGALGDGGAIMTNDDVIAEKIKFLRNYGSKVKYQHDVAGVNSRLDEIQAAFLVEKLKYLDRWSDRRRLLAQEYSRLLAGRDIILPIVPAGMESVWHLYVIRYRDRNGLRAYLEEHGIATGVHYPIPPHHQECYQSYKFYNLPIADVLAAEVLSLPMSPTMSLEDVSYVAQIVIEYIEDSKK